MAALATGLALGTLGLIGVVNGVGYVQQAPSPPPEPAAAPEPEPAPAPPAEPAPAPVPEPDMSGGAIGRPPWGAIAPAALKPGLVDAMGKAVGLVTVDPKQLEQEIIAVNQEIQTNNLKLYEIKQNIEDINTKKYIPAREKYAIALSSLQTAQTEIDSAKRKLNPQQGNLSKEEKTRLNKIVEKGSTASDKEKEDAREKLKASQTPKELNAEDKIAVTKVYSEAVKTKVIQEDVRDDSEREKTKWKVMLDKVRADFEEQSKTSRDLKMKLETLLIQLRSLRKSTVVIPNAADWATRTDRYAQAVDRFQTAENNLKAFLTETWNPMEGSELQKQYKFKLDSLTEVLRLAKGELRASEIALTENPTISVSAAADDFQDFVTTVDEITKGALDFRGNIIATYRFTPAVEAEPGTVGVLASGYPEEVRQLRNYATNTRLRALADIYYEISKQDTNGIRKNLPRYTSFFQKVLNKQDYYVNPNGFKSKKLTLDAAKELVQVVLERAENALRIYVQPGGALTPEQKVAEELRPVVNRFVDRQVSAIRKMFDVLKTARQESKSAQLRMKEIYSLEQYARSVITLPARVPPTGRCDALFEPAMLKGMRDNKYKGKNILEDVFTNGDLKDQFLKELGFIRVTSFGEAQSMVKNLAPSEVRPTLLLIKTAVFEEYVKRAELDAVNDPEGDTLIRGDDQGSDEWGVIADDAARLRNQTIGFLFSQPPAIARVIPPGYTQVTKKERAEKLRIIADEHPFVPGVYLKTTDAGHKPIQTFINACELDGNVGYGEESAQNVIKILQVVEGLKIDKPVATSPLLELIAKLKERGIANLDKPDQGVAIGTLASKQFRMVIGNWTIMKVNDDNKKINFLETFLTLRNSLFRSIPYSQNFVYKGESRPVREIYAELAYDEIKKEPAFRADRPKDSNFPDDSDWNRISQAYDINIVIYHEVKNGAPWADIRSATGRHASTVYHVFKAVDGMYYPVRMQELAGVVNTAPLNLGRNAPAIRTINRRALEVSGGAITGPEFPTQSIPGFTVKDVAIVGPALDVAYKKVGNPLYNRIFPPPPPAAVPPPPVVPPPALYVPPHRRGGRKTWRRSMPTRYTRRKI